jgi:hypothetical protein
MGLRFLPNKNTMCKEIEQWIALRKLDTLLSVCDCCVYKVFDYILTQECRTCSVRKGIIRIMDERSQRDSQEEELLQTC